MPIRVIVNGASGRMGQETVKAVQQDSELELVGQTGHKDNLAEIIKSSRANVVVDFTNASVVFNSALSIINAGAHPVIGTSGLKAPEISELKKLCAEKKLGGIIAPNFCIGAVLMMKFAQEAAKYMPDVEIIEMHHGAKLDAPSGTAMKTAEMIAEVRKQNTATKQIHETIPGSRGATSHGIPIHAIRLTGVVADQDVIFGNQGETLTLRHATINREAFMPGVRLACKKAVKLDKLIYGLEHVL